MRLLLTSSGLENEKVKKFFIQQFDRLDNKTAGLVYAVMDEEEREFVELSRKELLELGVKVVDVDITKEDLYQNYPIFDIYYICGGNTFFILDCMRRTGIQNVITDAVKEKNGFYLGVSAGSILAGPDISAANFGTVKDKNFLGMHSLGSFNLVPFLIFPHYLEEDKKEVVAFKKFHFKEPVIAITDNQALYISDAENILIGEKGGMQFCENCKLKDLTE